MFTVRFINKISIANANATHYSLINAWTPDESCMNLNHHSYHISNTVGLSLCRLSFDSFYFVWIKKITQDSKGSLQIMLDRLYLNIITSYILIFIS